MLIKSMYYKRIYSLAVMNLKLKMIKSIKKKFL
jgi:hypothetical protein